MEILVTVGLVAVLSTIAIPAYRNYRENTFKTVIKADASTGYKMYHTYQSVNGTFCGTLASVGLGSLETSENYGRARAFAGFTDASDCIATGSASAAANDFKLGQSNGVGAAACVLTSDTFTFGVAAPSSDGASAAITGYFVNNANGSPQETSSSRCKNTASGKYVKCASRTDCESSTSTDCGGAGKWEKASGIADVCKQ